MMMTPRSRLSCFSVGIIGVLAATANGEDTLDYDVLEYINPLIGSAGGGIIGPYYNFAISKLTSLAHFQAMSSPARHCLMAWQKLLPIRIP